LLTFNVDIAAEVEGAIGTTSYCTLKVDSEGKFMG